MPSSTREGATIPTLGNDHRVNARSAMRGWGVEHATRPRHKTDFFATLVGIPRRKHKSCTHNHAQTFAQALRLAKLWMRNEGESERPLDFHSWQCPGFSWATSTKAPGSINDRCRAENLRTTQNLRTTHLKSKRWRPVSPMALRSLSHDIHAARPSFPPATISGLCRACVVRHLGLSSSDARSRRQAATMWHTSLPL